MTLARTMSAAVLALGLLAMSYQSAFAQEETPAAAEGPRVVVVPTLDGDQVTATVEARDVENLGAFQFVLVFDADRLQYERAEIGTFIEETGREKVCPDPVVTDGAVRLSCVTLRPEPAGPDGSGTLGTVIFSRDGHGTAEFSLDVVRLVDPNATHIESTTEGASIDLPDDRSFVTKNGTWLVAVGGAIAAVVVLGGLAFVINGRRQRTHLQSNSPQDL